jgi:predicted transcriptional regulator
MNNATFSNNTAAAPIATEGDDLRLTADLVSAFLSNHSVSGSDLPVLVEHLPALIKRIHRALVEVRAAHQPPIEEPFSPSEPASVTPGAAADSHATGFDISTLQPAVPIENSITPDYIVCLENGGRYRSLRPHLRSAYGMTPEAYRRRWGLPHDYPMVAPNYSKERSSVAIRSGLGRLPAGWRTTKRD